MPNDQKESETKEEKSESGKKEAEVSMEAEVKTKEESKEPTKNKKDVTVKNILIIDDSKALRRVLVKYISTKFYCNIFEADNGKEGIDLIKKEDGKIDLVLCDLMMPVMDGMTCIKEIKTSKDFNSIPIICLTAKSDKKTVTTCITLGAADFIVKPYDLVSVSGKIKKFIDLK